MSLVLLLLLMQDPPASREARTEWFPEGFAYRHPLADSRAPVSGVRLQFPLEPEGDFKIENRLATHLAVWRQTTGESMLEVQAEGGAFARFNFEENWDMDGVDFRFGFPLVARSGAFALKLHPSHVTSHLGDEYIERTGAKRITYARNEIALGLSWDLAERWRVAVEGGYALSYGEVNEPLRFMASAETVGRHFGRHFPETFAALNLTSFEEQDWGVQVSLEAGVWLRPEGSHRGVRLSVGYFTGPSPLTQFFDDYEEYWTLGLSVPF